MVSREYLKGRNIPPLTTHYSPLTFTSMKQDVRAWSAVGMLASGVGLSVAGFIAPPFGEISDSVLWLRLLVASLLTLGIAYARHSTALA